MRVLALDLSTKTGWAVLDEQEPPVGALWEYGLFEMSFFPEDYKELKYPFNYIEAAKRFAIDLAELVRSKNPDVIVIEETNPGRETYSQKLLEFLHCSLLRALFGLNVQYVRTGAWRKVMDLRMSKQDLKGNQRKNLEKAKKKAKEIRTVIKAFGTKKANSDQVVELKQQLAALQLGRITRKHLAVRMVNQMFNLNFSLVDNNQADAILLGVAYIKGAEICDGLRPKQKKAE